MRKPKDERAHVEKIGKDLWSRSVAAAMLCIRQDARLIGADKTRLAMAEEAAYRATGLEAKPFMPPGDPSQDFIDLCGGVLDRATHAAIAVQPAPEAV